jgi:hypothetical protein
MATDGWSSHQLITARGFAVLDPAGQKIGNVDDVFVDANGRPRYLGVRMGFFGNKTTFLPVQLVAQADPRDRAVWLSVTRDVARAGPVFDRDHDFTAPDEAEIWAFFGLGETTYVATEVFIWDRAS